LPGTAEGCRGAVGATTGKNEALGADAKLVPAVLVAVTVHVYVWWLVNPSTTTLVAIVVLADAEKPPSDDRHVAS
jgi:hypothetical protein